MKILLTPQESETIFHNALCNGYELTSNGYFDFSKEDWRTCRENWKKLHPNEIIVSFECVNYVTPKLFFVPLFVLRNES